MTPPTSTVSRKRTRSTNVSESNHDLEQATSTSTSSIVSNQPNSTAVLPKRQRNNPPPPPPPSTAPSISSRTNYSLRNRSLTSDTRPSSTRLSSVDTSNSSQRYNLRPRQLPSSQIYLPQVSTSHPITAPRRARRQIQSTLLQSDQPTSSSIVQPRQYRLVYISDDDDSPNTTTQPSASMVNTTFNLVTDDEDDEFIQSQPRRIARSTANNTGHNTRSRTSTDPTNLISIDNQDFTTGGVAHVRLNRAIEIVIDSIQSLEGAVNNFDQLVFGLIYGRLSTRNEFENIEGMIRLSRILNLNFPSRLTQDEINALPKIKFINKSDTTTSSILLAEKCPICLSEFNDQEIINKLHCTHLFHLECISTWLGENDSCPTCRRKVNGN
ncbi:unnamed protein product [Rotaria socialis]|uniref:RING-type domain-containing protein n=1 Tax=Rotaria socialis TaxID=392032 RepID=A0A818WL08_9BILA|nr:unnamed protein product [Rotaria socialis]CAF3726417.1 unnamed protein product [Rotaria socialis]CAF3771182.1 unnamed protein product [Rotaria socialis]CAF4242785.1 unnamed protein product [Rotaria socialis]CAF4383060.1 unnamed protein product [Rotaria socialis]